MGHRQASLLSNSVAILNSLVVIIIILRLFLQLALFQHDVCGVYCVMSENYGELVSDRMFDSYFLQKSFNALIVYCILNLTAKSETVAEINDYLLISSTLQLLLFVLIWNYMLKKLHVHDSINFLGLAFCILNPVVFFYHFHYYEIPDATLLLLGSMFTYAFMKRNFKYVFLLYILSWIIAPQARIIIFLCLLGWPYLLKMDSDERGQQYKPFSINENRTRHPEESKNNNLRTKIIVFLIFFIVNLAVALISPLTPFEYGTRVRNYLIFTLSIPLGALIQSGLFLFLFKSTRLNLRTIADSLSTITSKGSILVLLEILRYFLTKTLGRGPDLAMTSYGKGQLFTLYSWFFESISLPGLFFLMMVNTFGFGTVLLLDSGRSIIRNSLNSTNIRFISALFLLLFPFLTNTQTRHYLFIVPLVCLIYFRKFEISPTRMVLLVAMYLMSSRFFVLDPSVIDGDFDAFGLRQGPWALKSTYVFSLIYALLYLCVAIRWFDLPYKSLRMGKEKY